MAVVDPVLELAVVVLVLTELDGLLFWVVLAVFAVVLEPLTGKVVLAPAPPTTLNLLAIATLLACPLFTVHKLFCALGNCVRLNSLGTG